MADTLPLPHVRFSAKDYGRLVATGLLPERTELIDGELLTMAAQGIAHVECVRIISRVLEKFETHDTGVYAQATARLTDNFAPDPDLYVTRLPLGSKDGLPAPDILLAIEVSDSTWARDYNIKRLRYAAADIPEYWIVNLRLRQLVVCKAPQNGTYGYEHTFHEDELVQPTAFRASEIQVRALLPSAHLPLPETDEAG